MRAPLSQSTAGSRMVFFCPLKRWVEKVNEVTQSIRPLGNTFFSFLIQAQAVGSGLGQPPHSPTLRSCPRAPPPACKNHRDFRLLAFFKAVLVLQSHALLQCDMSQMSPSMPHLNVYIPICLNPVLPALDTSVLPMSACSTES